ncbi:YCF48-related protein [Pseudorhodoferax sp.]|uniref:YCF48-related protein n=1 Tax=Pseudorhodoferax sp. TaxID=1993553 RepID=UPI002DD6B934|nr:YCF48-related protein [Pseudorhodoferax sp.]
MPDATPPSSPKSARLSVQPLWAVAGLVLLVVCCAVALLQAPIPNPLQPWHERSIVDMLRFPIEVNAGRRLQVAPGAMFGVSGTSDGKRQWAVGAGGTILATDDGGRKWEAQSSGVQADLFDIHAHDDGERAWAVGQGGTVLHTTDAGRNWMRQDSMVTATLNSAHFFGVGERGWLVGEGGTILHAHDGGRRWTRQVSGTTRALLAVHGHADGQRAWVVGADGSILRTTDAGESWAHQSIGKSHLRSVHFHADGQHGWAAGGDGTILSTNTGGRTWTPQISGVRTTLRSVIFAADGQQGWIVGDDGTILDTHDGGQNWAQRVSGNQASLLSVHVGGDSLHGWAVGAGGTILGTWDGGTTWTPQASAGQARLSSVSFSEDGQSGWAIGAGGTILATTDRAQTWTSQQSGVWTDLWAVHADRSGKQGWAVGRSGTILHTAEGKWRWTRQDSGVPYDLQSVHFGADGQRGWATGFAGTLLHTSNGGESWVSQDSGTEATLLSVHAHDDGLRGWAVGADGTLLTTVNGGRNWTRARLKIGASLNFIHFNADGLRGWIVGGGGTILGTRDGGLVWAAQTSTSQARLWSVHFDAAGERGYAVGTGGTILFTDDGGQEWRALTGSQIGSTRTGVQVIGTTAQEVVVVGYPPAIQRSSDHGATWTETIWPLRYERYPAPWFWLCLPLVAWCWWRALHERRMPTEHGAEAVVATDAQISEAWQDRLGFSPLARGIARFLRNPATEPPLTLAVSGDWGSGKSSLMALVCEDLRKHGGRPVWINAWHHQKDEQFLAALLQAVRSQALPSSLRPEGWVFRLRLLWLRSRKHFVVLFLVLVAVSALSFFMLQHDTTQWTRTLTWAQKLWPGLESGTGKTPSNRDVAGLLGQALSLLALLAALRKALTAFGADPAVLLAATTERFRLKDASALTAFRARFSEQFDEVTQSLPQRMVIVIDDLDRCRPEAVLEVMEAVNFLVSSGRCFVLLGMATERVQAAIGLSLKTIATELAEPPAAEADTAPHKRARRRAYAREYMEKLVNLEIVVPGTHGIAPHELMRGDETEDAPARRTLRELRRVLQLWPLLVVASAIGTGWFIGTKMDWSDPAPAAVTQVAPLSPAPGSAAAPARAAAAIASTLVAPTLVTPSQPSLYPVPTVQPGDDRPIPWQAVVLPMGLLLVLGAGYALFRLRSDERSVRDSQDFVDALPIWMPLVRRQRHTPRALKRFANRVRYLAMLQQPERLDESRGKALARWLAARWRGDAEPAPDAGASATTPTSALPEDLIVALGALNEVCGANWRAGVSGLVDKALADDVHKAIAAHRKLGDGKPWPPTPEQMDAFERSLRGIRVPAS